MSGFRGERKKHWVFPELDLNSCLQDGKATFMVLKFFGEIPGRKL